MKRIAISSSEGRMTRHDALAKGRTETELGGREAASLGNHVNKSTARGSGVSSAEFSRALWGLQRTLWQVTDYKRLAGCHRWLAAGSGAASVQWAPGKAKWGGLQNSGSVWASPVAAVRISRLRAREVESAVETWKKKDPKHSVEFLTLTLRHSKNQSLKEIWDTISYAWRGITQGAAWRGGARNIGDKERFGITHWLRSTEVTLGKNGWHVHCHVLLFLKNSLEKKDRESLESRLFERWSKAAIRKGFRSPTRERGIRIEEAVKRGDAGAMGAYMAKGSVSSIGQEIARGQQKFGRSGSRTPFQILADLADSSSEMWSRNLAFWREWEKGSLGRRQMAWSKFSKEALGILALKDEEVLAENDEKELVDSFSVAQVAAENWKSLVPGTKQRLSDSIETRREVIEYVKRAKTPNEAAKNAAYVLEKFEIVHTSDIVKLDSEKPDEDHLPSHGLDRPPKPL